VGWGGYIEFAERWLGRARLIDWLLSLSLVSAMITAVVGYLKEIPFNSMVMALIAVSIAPPLAGSALFITANIFRNGKNKVPAEANDLRGERYRPSAPDDTFEVIEANPDVPREGEIIERKLRILLRNCSGKQVEANAPDWICSRDYITFQSQPNGEFWSMLQPEISPGRYGPETQTLSVAPNAIFRASIGLNQSYSVEDIKLRLVTKRVGMVVIPVTIDARELEWRTRL
jgi:hypothetical protein